jgi:hypothetical protein
VRPSLGRLARGLDAALRPLAELVAPAACPICGAETAGPPFCPDCRAELLGAAGSACPRCALGVGPWANLARGCSKCRGKALGFDAALALGPYFGPTPAAMSSSATPRPWPSPSRSTGGDASIEATTRRRPSPTPCRDGSG